jgi:aminopeptidase N
MNHWFSVQATRPQSDALDTVLALMQHEAFDFKNPNKLRSVIGAFCANNQVNFHHSSGKGYVFLVDQLVKLNTQNPQIAARLVTPLTAWRKYDERRQELIKKELKRLLNQPNLSKDVFEVVTKTLGNDA